MARSRSNDPVESRGGCIPSRGVPRWPDPVYIYNTVKPPRDVALELKRRPEEYPAKLARNGPKVAMLKAFFSMNIDLPPVICRCAGPKSQVLHVVSTYVR